MKDRELTEESFNLFLAWLAPDRDAAGRAYEAIRQRLIALFESRGCTVPEDLADETIDRVIRRLPAMIDSYTGDPVPYLLTVARHLYLEYLRKQPVPLPENPPDPPRGSAESPADEQSRACLERCLEGLSPKSRELVLAYYQQEKKAKIDFRKELARQMGIAVNALRLRMHRTREQLLACISECLRRDPA